ncbi:MULTISPECIES: pyruvate carboxylase subunit B [unclassified Pyramidobacter]|uniref:pyruvate carboxylase subunit B n=2 Tax=Pyramidobacter TaxID=638847 RepID=UPI00098ECC99|nr:MULTISPECIES: pyruvate carboxylase subunit B [unclassified Pyramidobacter]MCI7404498.1 pyruvate carboxylase subunit B [Pyramidobacter sp.]MDY3211603.1 pyruvate carboxylase subunit B [Pyramidobacter sp.]RKJ80563.1 oxaloacetate decarboxylase subunit alpha [Pyramidobacter sp. CG50-2]
MVSKKTRSSAAVEDEKADVQEKMPPAEEPAAQESAREISATRRVEITETVLRDAHQSLMATRMSLDDMLPVLDQMDEIGYHSLEVWGGATFDACMRFLDEDPWERLRTLKKHFKKTKLQMLLRGQNLVGYRHYADDTAKEFVKRAVGNGIDIIRIFDALNDLRNVEVTAAQTKAEGAHLQLCIAYTTSPVHTVEAFVKLASQMKDLGADSICIKDMAGLLTPTAAKELVYGIKQATALPIQVHSHYTCGLAGLAYYAAIEAGADVIDCALSPFSMGTSQPCTETFVAALAGSQWDTGLDIRRLTPISNHFKKIRSKYDKIFVKVQGANTDILLAQIPGGMYSNLVNQLKEAGQQDKLSQVLEEVPYVRAAMGYPPLVTPSSQIVGTQATLNVLSGERWKIIPKEVYNIFKGMYGQTPAPMDPEIQKKVLGGDKPITCRPADLIEPELEKARKEVASWITQPEDVLTYVLFPAVAKEFLVKKYARETMTDIGLNEFVDGSAYPV